MLTNYVGELLQHDTSFHLWSPHAERKWTLITTLDDFSRTILYGDLWEKESSWAHICALKAVVKHYECCLRYYVDNHSIFRFVERRDTMHRKIHQPAEAAKVEWKAVLGDLNINVVYALSPAAKGKIERPYRWLQDHLVRTCAREHITTIEQAREVLYEELYRYNYKRLHSTTKQIPQVRYQQALHDKQSLFRPFQIRWPFEKTEDIFCYRLKRQVNAYRKITLSNLSFSVSGVPLHTEVELRIIFNLKNRLATLRFWYRNRLVGEQQVKMSDLKFIQF